MRTTHRGATIGVGLVMAAVLCLGQGPIAGAEPKDARLATDPLLESLDMQFVKQITKHLGTIGANEDGFRVTGTPQDEETANYLADRMDAIGLEDVSVESLTTDGWLFTGGSVTAKGGGIGLDVPLLIARRRPWYAERRRLRADRASRYGTAPEYEGLDVEGKIAFAWWDYDNLGIWPNYIATRHTPTARRQSSSRVGAGQRVVRRGRWTRARRKRRRMQHNRVRPVGRDQPAERPRACGRARRRHREGLRLVGG